MLQTKLPNSIKLEEEVIHTFRMLMNQVVSHFEGETSLYNTSIHTQDDSNDKASLVYIGEREYNYNKWAQVDINIITIVI